VQLHVPPDVVANALQVTQKLQAVLAHT
jgi:hypothetical protein